MLQSESLAAIAIGAEVGAFHHMHFLSLWGETHHPEYDFDTGELVYRDAAGNEMRRAFLGVLINGARVARPLSASATEGPGSPPESELVPKIVLTS